MSPNSMPTLMGQPRLEARQNDGNFIPSITRSSTTFTTTVNIASSTAMAASMATTNDIRPRSPDDSNTGVIIGAVLGSILGTLVLITLFYKCCIDNRSVAWIPPIHASYESDSDPAIGRSGVRGGMRTKSCYAVILVSRSNY
jgi:hypothetical protein